MTFQTSEEYRRAWDALRRHGLLLLQDPLLPNLAALVAGRTVPGSWWGHPAGRRIHAVSNQIAGHPEVLVAKLLSGKVTYVHRVLWPAFLAVARCREPWQVQGLPPASQALLRQVDHQGEVDPSQISRGGLRTPGSAINELERRLLVHTEEVHTATGAHARLVETWDRWMERARWRGATVDPRIGKERMLDAVRGMCRESGGLCKLPWEGSARR